MKLLPSGIAVIEGDNYISKWVEESGRLDHDQNMLPLVLPYIIPGMYVIDIGAYIGDHTVAYAKAVGANGRVYAFEPYRAAFECLMHNMQNYPRVVLYQQGIGCERTLASIQPRADDNPGANMLVAAVEEMAVLVEPLDTKELPADFIKIDAEGCEYNILIGATNTLDRYRPKLLIEINRAALKAQGSSAERVFRYLDRHGYTYANIYPGQSLEGEQLDILCLPKQDYTPDYGMGWRDTDAYDGERLIENSYAVANKKLMTRFIKDGL